MPCASPRRVKTSPPCPLSCPARGEFGAPFLCREGGWRVRRDFSEQILMPGAVPRRVRIGGDWGMRELFLLLHPLIPSSPLFSEHLLNHWRCHDS